MKHLFRILREFIPVATAVLLSGCIVSDPVYVEYAIEPDLAGEVVIEITGIHSDEDDPVKRNEEFEQYCDEGYLEQGREMALIFGLDEARISLTNRTDRSCELIVEGGFDNLARALSVLAGEHDYEIRKSGRLFIARLLTGTTPASDDDNEFTLVVQFAGDILTHNAQEFDVESGTMTWLQSGIDESGVQFILKAEE